MPAYPWQEWLAPAFTGSLSTAMTHLLDGYLDLLLRWNARTNLTSVQDPEGIARRHFAESLSIAQTLPPAPDLPPTMLDHGSGAGFPGLPIAILRPEITVTLSESQHKKAAFLREAVRTLALPNVLIHAGRTEKLTGTYTWVTARAVDGPESAFHASWPRVAPGGWLVTSGTIPHAQPATTHTIPGTRTTLRMLQRGAA